MKRHEPSRDDLGIAESRVTKHRSTPTETARMSFLSGLTHSRLSQLANTIAVVSAMGGVGRTSITANVAADLAASGRRVLAVDLDTQGNLGQDLGYVDHAGCDRGASLQELFTPSTSGGLRILHGVRERLDVVCGGEKIGVAAQALPHPDSVHYGHTLTRALASVADRYDLIIMDCPRQIGGVTLFALAAARGVVVPIRGDDSIRGLNLAARPWIQVLNELNPALSLLGVVLSQIPAGATRLRSEPRDRLRRDHPDLHIFDAIIRSSARSALDTRRLGVVAAEYKTMRDSARSKAAAGLADDYHALRSEIVDRLSAVNAKV